jgi:hypothetical protein
MKVQNNLESNKLYKVKKIIKQKDMEKFESFEDLGSDIQAICQRLKTDSLTREELETFVEKTRNLYERSLILRYKLYETEVFGQPVENQDSQVEAEVQEELEEVQEVESSSEMTEEEPPLFSFNLFEEESNVEASVETPNVSIEQESHTIEDKEVEEPIIEEPIVYETPVAPPVFEAQKEEAMRQESETVTLVENTKLNQLFLRTFNEMKGQVGITRLETLVGSFGLNERLLFINELFDGSAESFSEAIKTIDTKTEMEQTISFINQLGSSNQWDLESDTVEEFLQKVVRRHV